MSQSGYRRLTNAKFTSYFPLWMVRTRQVLLRLNHVLDIVFIFVGTCCSWSTTSRLPSIFFTSLLTLCRDHFFRENLFYYSCAAPAFLSITAVSLSLNTIFYHEQKDLVCQNEIPVSLFKANSIPHVILECDTLAS